MAAVKSVPLNSYGAFQGILEAMHKASTHRLSWEKQNDFQRWKQEAQNFLKANLHWNFPRVPLQSEILESVDTGEYIRQKIAFSSCGFFRLTGFLLLPKNIPQPLPTVLLLHDWGGPMFFGMDRVVNTGRNCPFLDHFREFAHGGVYLSETFCRAGFAVFIIDAWHFGWRAPRKIGCIPEKFDPFEALESYEGTMLYHECEKQVRELLFTGIKQLNWAGTTWAGLNFNDDQCCIDYLLSRPEIDASRIFVTGLSGGAYRTNILCALDDRIRAGASIGWMTGKAEQQIFNFNGAINVFCMLPGVWSELDLPDLAVMAMPKPMLFSVGTKDHLFPPEGVDEAFASIRRAAEQTGCRIALLRPEKIHCYDLELQEKVCRFFHTL